MSRSAVSRFRGAALRLATVLAIGSVAGTAVANPSDANHRFERIGWSIGNVAAVVRVPNEMRVIIVTKDGEIHRVVGDRLLDEYMGRITVSQSCAGDGVLGAAWDTVTNQALYVTYISSGTRKFTVARLDVSADGLTVSAPVKLYDFALPASTNCTNLGGGITMANDGRLLVGIGDLGNGPGAGQQSVVSGKIWRLESTGTGGPATDNPNPLSPVYSLGVRNPVRLANDPMTGNIWFVDLGPTANDELNWISGPQINFAWPRTTGPYNTTGFRDPAWTWTTSINPVGLIVNRGENFGAGWLGDLIVTTANGTMRRVHPVDLTDPINPVSEQSTIFTPGTGEPGAMVDGFTLSDGYAYVATPSGELYRLRSAAGAGQEPSDASSIVPTLVTKLSDGSIDLLTENETGAQRYGFYPGDLASFYSHFNAATPLERVPDCTTTTGGTQGCIDATVQPGSAWATIHLTPTQVNAMPDAAYFVLSAINGRGESVVGTNSNGQWLPGGNQTFGCPCPFGSTVGPATNQCGPDFTVAQGTDGPDQAVGGPFVIPEQYQCNVVLLDLSAEWCGPCRAQAADAESLYQQFKDRGFVMIHAINERAPRGTGPCDVPCAQRWASDFGATFPVLADSTSQAWDNYNMINAWPQSLLISRDGMVVRRFDGGQSRATLEAAIEAEVSR